MYIVQELQTTNGVTSLVPAVKKDSLLEAESAFHSACAAAAVSNIEIHTVIVYDEHGNVVERKYYEHIVEEPAE